MCASLCFLGLHSRFNPSLGASVAHAALFACLQGVRLVAERGRLMEDASAATAAEGHQRDDGPECMAAVRSTEVIQTRKEGTPERHCLVDGTLRLSKQLGGRASCRVGVTRRRGREGRPPWVCLLAEVLVSSEDGWRTQRGGCSDACT